MTVILESEWILRRVYHYSKSSVGQVLEQLTTTENITVERIDMVQHALDLAAQGADFADALHLASSAQCDWLASFDKDFVKFGIATAPPVRHP